jgi:hypothetical protein
MYKKITGHLRSEEEVIEHIRKEKENFINLMNSVREKKLEHYDIK